MTDPPRTGCCTRARCWSSRAARALAAPLWGALAQGTGLSAAAQHHTRQTVTDRRFEELARSFLLPGTTPEATHAFDAAAVAAGKGHIPPAPPPPAPEVSPASGAGQDG
ncbi:hypothetical protein [Streptomyces sp. NPDC058457]|uniref:hypothetical protein n=1 Tax=Streptomyces sp. NPDC058457 TaxID=3346507 RepID=UPI00365ADD53